LRKIVLLTLVIAISNLANSQSWDQLNEVADQYYDLGKYKEAVEFYERIHELKPRSLHPHLKLALSLYHSLRYEEAMLQFKELADIGYLTEEVLYYYGWLLKTEGLYRRADSVFNVLINLQGAGIDYLRLARFQQEGCRLGIRMLKIKNPYNLKEFEQVNSTAHDFGFVRHGNKAALSSTRDTKQRQYYDGQFGGLLPNILEIRRNEIGYWEKGNAFDGLNNKWGQGTGCFSPDGAKFYYSSCRGNEGCKIYVSTQLEDGSWSERVELNENINKPPFDSKQPNLSITGDTLFFVTNRPGGQGGTDVWMSFKVKADEWAPPINMGATINTPADEISPFYSSRFRALLFASNGHAGYGGYDLYMAKGISFYSPKIYNLGPPFNSSYDDCYFYIHNTMGYISTSRNRSDFNIYSFNYSGEVEMLSSFLTDESLIDVALKGAKSLDLYAFRYEEHQGYSMLRPVQEEPREVFLGEGNFQTIVGEAAPNAVIRFNLNDTLEMLTRADADGLFEIRMVSDTLHDHVLTEDNKVIDYSWKPLDFKGYKYDFEKIYFDFDSHQLREESKETLRDLIANFDPDNVVMIDVHTHTDHFGDHDYNYALSENRGLAILEFLEGQGITYEQMRIFPNGEKNLLSDHDSWYSRLFNRRAEIVVYTEEPVSFAVPEVFIIRKDVSVADASRFLQIPDGKLHDWNAIPSAVSLLREGHVLRVFDPKHITPNYSYLIPEDAAGKDLIYYTIKPGDTFSDLSDKFSVPEEIINEENRLNGVLTPGDEIVIYPDDWLGGR
jgi:peptidoglycan-associated lipoprotein